MNSIELEVKLTPKDPWADIVISQLAELGFDAFEDMEGGVKAYGPENKINTQEVLEQSILGEDNDLLEISYTFTTIPFQNWNEKWESDFDPVFVEDKLTILAPFHDKSIAKGLSIEIQPQMSFGTGHHQTTWLMSKRMFAFESFPNRVLDMGTGTGVLAILAEKLGAKDILAIDIEEWSAENTIENALRNNCENIVTKWGDVDLIEGLTFDLILANINKNVLKHQIPSYSKALVSGGKLLLSGFFTSDVDEIVAFASEHDFSYLSTLDKETWACVLLEKK